MAMREAPRRVEDGENTAAALGPPCSRGRAPMRKNVERAVVLAGVLALLAGTSSALASAGRAAGSAERKAAVVAQVRGTQVPVNPANGRYEMRGDLVGEWLVVSGKILHDSSTLLVVSGKERFKGCLDRDGDARCEGGEPSGAMRFAYLYWASFDSGGNLIRGKCVHPVTRGSGAFTGARGVLRMYDRPVAGGEVRTTYRGRLVLPGRGRKTSPAPPTPDASATRPLAPRRPAC
jgi:hypothetical protein